MKLKIGDRVEDLIWHRGLTGTVIEVIPGHDMVDHGFVTVQVDPEHLGKFPLSPPNEEHYVEFEWWKTLRKLSH